MDFINAAQLSVCQVRPNCFGCTKEQMNSLSLACKEPAALLSLSGQRYNEMLFFVAHRLSGSHFVCPQHPLSHCLSHLQHNWPFRITYHTCPHSHNDCPYSYIHHAMGHLLLHTGIVPALLEMNSWQRGDFLPQCENCKSSTL